MRAAQVADLQQQLVAAQQAVSSRDAEVTRLGELLGAGPDIDKLARDQLSEASEHIILSLNKQVPYNFLISLPPGVLLPSSRPGPATTLWLTMCHSGSPFLAAEFLQQWTFGTAAVLDQMVQWPKAAACARPAGQAAGSSVLHADI